MHARHGCCRGTRGGTRAVTGHQSHRRQFPVRPQQQRQQQLCNSTLLARRPLPLSGHAPNDTTNTITQPSSQARAMQHGQRVPGGTAVHSVACGPLRMPGARGSYLLQISGNKADYFVQLLHQ